jgi:hypothetical protein
MANIDHTIKYKVSAPYATSLRLVSKPNKPWAAYPSGYTLMSGAPNIPLSSAKTPPAFGTEYSWIYRTSSKYAHEVTNIIVETTCIVSGSPEKQFGDIYYAFKPTCNIVAYSTGTEPISGDPALIFTWTSLCDTCNNVKEYIITYVETGSGNTPFSVTIPIATVLASPGFPDYTAYITDSVNPLITYDVTFQAVLTYEYDVDPSLIDPTGHITVEQYIDGCINP